MEVGKAECPAVELLLRAGPLQDVEVVVLLAGSQAELAHRGPALSLERALRGRHGGEGGQNRVGGRQVPGPGWLRAPAAVPAEPPLLLLRLQALGIPQPPDLGTHFQQFSKEFLCFHTSYAFWQLSDF